MRYVCPICCKSYDTAADMANCILNDEKERNKVEIDYLSARKAELEEFIEKDNKKIEHLQKCVDGFTKELIEVNDKILALKGEANSDYGKTATAPSPNKKEDICNNFIKGENVPSRDAIIKESAGLSSLLPFINSTEAQKLFDELVDEYIKSDEGTKKVIDEILPLFSETYKANPALTVKLMEDLFE